MRLVPQDIKVLRHNSALAFPSGLFGNVDITNRFFVLVENVTLIPIIELVGRVVLFPADLFLYNHPLGFN